MTLDVLHKSETTWDAPGARDDGIENLENISGPRNLWEGRGLFGLSDNIETPARRCMTLRPSKTRHHLDCQLTRSRLAQTALDKHLGFAAEIGRETTHTRLTHHHPRHPSPPSHPAPDQPPIHLPPSQRGSKPLNLHGTASPLPPAAAAGQ